MGKARGPARPCINPAPWAVAKRIKRRRCLQCQQQFDLLWRFIHCRQQFELRRSQFCSSSCAGRYFAALHAPTKHRSIPLDFEQVFVQIGRAACQEHYRAGRKAVTRWLKQRGEQRLIEARAAFVRTRFMAERATRERLQLAQTPVSDFRFVHPDLVDAAVAWLRNNYPGGWKVCPTGDGDWWIGLTRSSAAEVVDLATRYGFDAEGAVLTGEGEDGVGSGA